MDIFEIHFSVFQERLNIVLWAVGHNLLHT